MWLAIAWDSACTQMVTDGHSEGGSYSKLALGGRAGLSVLTSLLASADVKFY